MSREGVISDRDTHAARVCGTAPHSVSMRRPTPMHRLTSRLMLSIPRSRLGLAVLASLLVHALLLSGLTGTPAPRIKAAAVHALTVNLSDAPVVSAQAPQPAELSPEPGPVAEGDPDASTRARQATPVAGLIPEPEHYFRGSEVDQRADPLNLPDIRYPEQALQARMEGRVTLRLLIDRDGVLRDVSVVSAEPRGVFEEVALQAARSIRFRPAMRGGRPVASVKLIEVPFFPDCLRTGSCVPAQPASP